MGWEKKVILLTRFGFVFLGGREWLKRERGGDTLHGPDHGIP
jgi:hypothetical protein